MESISQIGQPEQSQTKPGSGCLSEIGWFFSGAVLPIGSLTFYRQATQRSVGKAILFFFVFTSVIACLLTTSVAIAMFSLMDEIQNAYTSGQVPEITISKGVTQVSGTQPLVLIDNENSQGQRIFAAIDTTGKITRIDQARYYQGFLLTRTELHVLNRGEYQKVPLSEVNNLFERDPLIINADSVRQAWGIISAISAVVVLIFLWLWHFMFRLMIILVYALIFWGIVSLFRPNVGFGVIITCGLYAIVPAIYISHLFSRSGFSLPGLQSLFLVGFWVIGLIASLLEHPLLKTERPMRTWTALLGVPMLILFIIDSIAAIPAPYGVIALWAITILTVIALVSVRLFFRYRDSRRFYTDLNGATEEK